MKQPRINRRKFFKLSAFGASTVAAAPSQEAQAAAEQPHKLAIPQPTFNSIASTTAFGPPTDISMGWDGTLWAIDASGAPHLYDPTQDAWVAHGNNLSAAAWLGTTYYWFLVGPYAGQNGVVAEGAQVATAPFGGSVSSPQPLKAAFPNVPDSFALHLSGAANVAGTLMLFSGGRYVLADGSAAAVALSTLTNWPTAAGWADGIVDAVHSDGTANVMLFIGAEFVIANLQTKTVISGPSAVGSYAPWQNRLPSGWATTGIDAAFTQGGNVVLYKGTAVATFVTPGTGAAAAQYIPTVNPTSWPATWHPVLNHAPQGRINNLWVATKTGGAVQHDGEMWNVRDNAGNGATNVAVGQDNSVFLCGAGSQTLWQWGGTSWLNIATSSVVLSQVAVGSANHVFARGSDNSVQRLGAGNALSAVNLGAGVPAPTHIAANSDGTLWHANNSPVFPFAFRLISESSAPSALIPVKNGIVTSVQKVAATGFGSAHVLATQSGPGGAAQPAVYRYDSPYVFKTSTPYNISNYGAIERGLGLLYMLIEDSFLSGQNPTYYVVAVDAQTGAEVARSAGLTALRYGGLVFDPLKELVYVGTTATDPSDQDTLCELLALDARTLSQVWSYTDNLMAGIDAAPGLSGTRLCFGNRNGFVYMFDTDTRTQLWYYGPQPPGGIFQQNIRIATPIITNGRVYAVVYMLGDASDSVVFVYSANTDDNSNAVTFDLGTVATPNLGNLFGSTFVFPPALGTMEFDPQFGDVPALFVNGGNTVYALDTTGNSGYSTFTLPAGQISSGFAYDDGTRLGQGLSSDSSALDGNRRLWFGDSLGNLWSLLPNAIGANPVSDNTPYQFQQNTSVNTTPVLYKDPQGGLTVLFGVFSIFGALIGGGVPSLYGYDPENGNVASVPTGATQVLVLSQDTSNGVVYAGGVFFNSFQASGEIPQAFGIRVDQLPQALRDFVIESQMLQDPDENAPGGNVNNTDPDGTPNPIPPSRARYQTHLTVVDDQKSPQVHEAVKIWADAPTTIQVLGYLNPFPIGPGDSQYALVKTGVDGAIVITSGYAKPDGSDTPDMYAPALRVWASFMNPFERIVVNPDHEFHIRTSTAHDNASDDDPDKVNLVTTKSYAGTTNSKTPSPLFTSDEVTKGVPGKCATAIGQMKSGVGFGGGGNTNAASALFGKLMLHAGGRKQARQTLRRNLKNASAANASASAAPSKYVAYTDLPNMGFFPTNIPATRPTTVVQPTGLIFSQPDGQPPENTTLQVVRHTDALAAIDALPSPTVNPPWQPTAMLGKVFQRADGVYVITGTQNWWTDFWNWLKGLFAKIEALIVSIADEVMVGINLIVNGIKQVFKAIVKVIDDIASAIGSFFKMILKFIEDVIAALSVLFHFGEIIQTHKWLRDQVNANLQQAIGAMQNQVKTPVDAFFQQGDTAIENLFSNIRQQLGINDDTQINSVNSARSTPHTAFNAGPGTIGPNSGGSSHAVQCTHTTHKMKNGLPSATSPSGQGVLSPEHPEFVEGSKDTPAVADDDDDALSAFVTNFVNSLENDPVISAAFNNLKSAVNNIGQSQSAGDFFKSALNLLLTVVEDLILGMVAVTQALVDGLIGAVQALVNTVVGLLNTPVDIPFISWLYQLIFGEPLTILNAVSLVAAIPVTIIYRVVEEHYPSQDGITGTTSVRATQPRSATAITPDVIKKIQGLIGGVIAFGLGIARAVVDAAGANPPRIGTIFVLTFGVAYAATFFPLMIPGATPTADQWAEWGLGLGLALLGTFGVISLKGASAGVQTAFRLALTFLRVGQAIARFIVFIVAFAQSSNRNAVTDVQFARNLFLELPPMFNWLKLLPDPANIVLTVIDVVTGIVVCVLDITAAFLTTARAPRRYYFPFVAVSGGVQAAPPHPLTLVGGR